jgi:LAO/AO transport system kinase
MELVDAVLAGERLALARLLTQVENDTPPGRSALDALFSHTGKAHLVGITGAPGTGKSSLVNQVARLFRRPPAASGAQPRKVAIVAIDPSSPFTGGALLGDRVRMRDLAGDPGIFIRSMAARGALGGLARATAAAVQVFDAAGYEIILIETVGAGQNEVDIAGLAHTTLVVDTPGMGDDIQAIKAGILEIADILVINKADHPGLENTQRSLRSMLELGHPKIHPQGKNPTEDPGWIPPILSTIATTGSGVEEVFQAILRHGDYLKQSGEWQKRDRMRLQVELDALIQEALVSRWRSRVSQATYQALLELVFERQISPLNAVSELMHFDVNYVKDTRHLEQN